jgi:hypothetical protein
MFSATGRRRVVTDAFSGFGPHEESLFGKIPIWEAMIIGQEFARMLARAFSPYNGEFIEGTSVVI